MKIIKSFIDPDNPNISWGIDIEGFLYFKDQNKGYRELRFNPNNYIHEVVVDNNPIWEVFDKKHGFGISLRTMKYILNNFSNLLPFA